ncbi:YXYXY domain-containing protein [Taibaiella chishuiensis]|uniref:Oxygen sensor histidine kinase NreB n=1 Tax=Taibaiella chishuiensis TaxID=1434707 RepID=A0A2P8D253_9BACT|nr:YXYXY domain-containing protein [Taibaiella chishuiensis]
MINNHIFALTYKPLAWKLKYITILLHFGLLLCFTQIASGQSSDLDFTARRLSQNDGLSQGSNYFRFEDSRGFMWITCNDAVNRYDGNTVKVYHLDKYFKNCANLQQGYGFAEDEQSNIYIGSIRGLYIYNRNTDKFSLRKIFTNGKEDLAMPFACKEGKIWCFNKNYEIATYQVSNGQVSYIARLPLPAMASIHVYAQSERGFYERWPFMDRDNNIWVFGRDAVCTLNIATQTVYEIKLGSQQKEKPVILASCYDAAENRVWLGTANGALIYDIATARVMPLTHMGGIALGKVAAICCNATTVVLKSDNGLLFNDKPSRQYQWLQSDIQKSKTMYTFSFDKAGCLWMCDDGFGQIIYDFTPKILPKHPKENSVFAKLREFSIGEFGAFPNGDIYIMQYNLVLDHRTRELKKMKYTIPLDPATPYRMTVDKLRQGTWIYQMYYKNRQLRIFFWGKDRKLALKGIVPEASGLGECQHLQVLPDGRVIISFVSGLAWLQNGKVVAATGQPYNNTFYISLLSQNRCAVSYLDRDMWLADITGTDTLKFVRRILPGVQSFYMQEDTLRERYWVGTNKGVYLLDRHFGLLRRFDANNGLAGTYIYGLLLDDQGNAWCSHQRGLSSIDAQNLQIINYDQDDGIQDWDYNNRSFYKATDGTLLFGGVSGFNYFKPPLKRSYYYKPEVYVDEILVNHKSYLPDINANLVRHLQLPYTENNIIINAIVKDLGSNKSHKLVYRLAGADHAWHYQPEHSAISFNNLAPGHYALDLGIYDKYSNKTRPQKTIYFTIALPFYRELWFGVLVAVLATTITGGIWIRRKLNRQRIALQQQLALDQQRNKITADLHDDIGASLSSLQLNSAVASKLIHKDTEQAKEMLQRIELQSWGLADRIDDMIWSMKSGNQEVTSINNRITNFACDILGATLMRYEIRISKEVDQQVRDMTTRKNIILITKEAINNAVKHSGATHLSVDLDIKEDKLTLVVKDNGQGYVPGQATGNGLANMKKRAEEAGGTFTIRSAPAQGTTVTVIIPVLLFSDKA